MVRTNKHHLTDRQRRFADAYLELGNATRAAIEAGFAPAYAANAKRQPAVQAYLAERRAQMPVQTSEVINFLTGVMRGQIKADKLRTEAAYQIGVRAGMWRSEADMERKIKEAMTNE